MTMNDQETISSRPSLDTARIKEPHHDDDLDTPLQLDVTSFEESSIVLTLVMLLEDAFSSLVTTLHSGISELCISIVDGDLTTQSHHHFELLVSRMSLIEHQLHYEKQHDQ